LGGEENEFAELSCMLLVNLTRSEKGCQLLLQVTEEPILWGFNLLKLLSLFCSSNSSQINSSSNSNSSNSNNNNNNDSEEDEKRVENPKLDGFGWIAIILMNCTQTTIGRSVIFDANKEVIKEIVPFLKSSNVMRRRGISGTLRNGLLLKENHFWLNEEKAQLLPSLLYPLYDESFQFKEDEKNGLSFLLSIIPKGKKLEVDKMCRKHLLESLLMFSKNKTVNLQLREKQLYPFMRELDSLEEEEDLKELIVQIVEYLVLDWENSKFEGNKEETINSFQTSDPLSALSFPSSNSHK